MPTTRESTLLLLWNLELTTTLCISFTLAPSLLTKEDLFPILETFVEQPEGLFLTASFFNHSCCGNASWSGDWNDTIFVRARSDIKAGEEVLIPYCDVGSKLRSQTLKRKLDSGRCACELCVMDKLEGKANVQRRLELVKAQRKVDSFRSNGKISQESATFRSLQIIEDLQETYAPTRGVVRPAMRHSWLSLLNFRSPTTPFDQHLVEDQYLVSAIRCIGGVVTQDGEKFTLSVAPFCYVKEIIKQMMDYAAYSDKVGVYPWAANVAMEMDRLHMGSFTNDATFLRRFDVSPEAQELIRAFLEWLSFSSSRFPLLY